MKFPCKSIWSLVLGFLVLIGCQTSVKTDYDKLDLAEVTGTIKLDGVPLSDAYVIFQGEDLTYSFGKTDRSGQYTLMLNSEKSGILPGEKTVKIRLSRAFGAEGASLDNKSVGEVEASGDTEGGETEGEDADEGEEPAPDAQSTGKELHVNYHQSSQVKASVQSGSQRINFDLKSNGTTVGPE